MIEYTLEAFEKGQTLLIDKPFEWTSFDVVNKVRYIIKNRLGKRLKVGHAGTLDPLATGLLVICTGKFTKKLAQLQADEKEYTGTIKVGATTPSFDLETEISERFPIDHITEEQIRKTAQDFLGEQDQIAPLFSAKRIDGKRAYELARKGLEGEVKASRITIHEFEITGIDKNEQMLDIHFRITCSKGTYIRSIARDFGQTLGSGAYLENLRRTRSGDFLLENAITMQDFDASIPNP